MHLLKKLLYLFILFYASSAFSQDNGFAPVGAIWYYKIKGVSSNSGGYAIFKAERDTIIEGKHCAVISATIYPPNQGYKLDSTFILTQDSLQIQYFTEGRFTTIYDFGAVKGTTWSVEEGFNINTITVLDTDSILIGGKKLKRLIIKHSNLPKQDTLIEKIGPSFYFIPIFNTKKLGFITFGLNCYSDSTLIYKHIDGACETMLAVGTNEYALTGNQLTIYPNPFTSSFSVKSVQPGKPIRIMIYNQAGKLMYADFSNTDALVSLPDLAPSLYLLRIQDEKSLYKQVLIKM